ncbi:hypothetical protein EU538_05675 [Candidatus Thorarchaeota archaeon]|jgi:nitroreductase|nr:MAG: hypothetical protein EU538_05675 [Candidatus Thorarchaeota archaeon]
MHILEEISQRYSPPIIDSREVEKEKVEAIFEAARRAPSCYNKQPWRFVVVKKEDETRKALEDALSLGNGWAKRAAILVAATAKPSSDCDTNGIPYYAYDVGMSVMSMTIEAEHQGLKCHQMAGYREKRVKDALALPQSSRVLALIAVGYEGEVESLSDKILARGKEAVTKSKERLPIDDIVFWGRYVDE